MWSYDRERLVQLRRRTASSIEQLGSLTSSDPEAAGAVQAVRSSMAMLELDWLPLIDSIVSSGILMQAGPRVMNPTSSSSWSSSWWSSSWWSASSFASDPSLSCSLPGGDHGGTYGYELRSPFVVQGSTRFERGRNAIVAALRHTADARQIHRDEFEIVQTGPTEFVVVLPGVTDLSRFRFGLDPVTRTVRDVDVSAFPSSANADLTDNRYAVMVRDAMAEIGVPSGANLMIVGHSYGADTALDLAADPTFNGPDGYHVTHVVAAAYDSEPQLRFVPESTEVLVLQNNMDAAVIVERAGRGPVAALEEVQDIADEIAALEYGRLAERVDDAPEVAGRVMWNTAWSLFDATRDVMVELPDLAADMWDRDLRRLIEDLPGPIQEPSVRHPTESQTVAVFSGGTEGVGHHQDNYIDYLSGPEVASLTGFFGSVVDGGYATTGTSYAVDVSVPESE